MMSHYWLRIALTGLMVGLCADSGWAQLAPQTACQSSSASRTAIYYVNGVTKTLDQARLNGGKLEMEFLNRLPSMPANLQAACYLFFLNSNPTSIRRREQ